MMQAAMRPLVFVLPHAVIFWVVFLWSFFPERSIVQRARAESKKEGSKDAGSIQVIMVTGLITALAGFGLAPWTQMSISPGARLLVFYAGTLVILLGSLLRRLCFKTLGEHFTGDVRARADQPVIQTGPYRWVRHPSYTAGMIMYLGIGLALTSWVSIAFLFGGTIIGYAYRVRVEERALLAEIGAPYGEFMRTRKRFIPYVI
jgi:protein-S-isoprenylcysteine O-methyltransferase Ste14